MLLRAGQLLLELAVGVGPTSQDIVQFQPFVFGVYKFDFDLALAVREIETMARPRIATQRQHFMGVFLRVVPVGAMQEADNPSVGSLDRSLKRHALFYVYIRLQPNLHIRGRFLVLNFLMGSAERAFLTEGIDAVGSFGDDLDQIAVYLAVNQGLKCFRPRVECRLAAPMFPVNAVRVVTGDLGVPLVNPCRESPRDRAK